MANDVANYLRNILTMEGSTELAGLIKGCFEITAYMETRFSKRRLGQISLKRTNQPSNFFYFTKLLKQKYVI